MLASAQFIVVGKGGSEATREALAQSFSRRGEAVGDNMSDAVTGLRSAEHFVGK